MHLHQQRVAEDTFKGVRVTSFRLAAAAAGGEGTNLHRPAGGCALKNSVSLYIYTLKEYIF